MLMNIVLTPKLTLFLSIFFIGSFIILFKANLDLKKGKLNEDNKESYLMNLIMKLFIIMIFAFVVSRTI